MACQNRPQSEKDKFHRTFHTRNLVREIGGGEAGFPSLVEFRGKKDGLIAHRTRDGMWSGTAFPDHACYRRVGVKRPI